MLTQAIRNNFNGALKNLFFSPAMKFFSHVDQKSEDDRIYHAVDKILEERIRPILQQDGTDVILEDVVDGTLVVSVKSGCISCSCRHPRECEAILEIMQYNVPGVTGIREKLDFE